MFADSEYRPHAVQLSPGDRLVLLTDGILEAGPDRDNPFGLDRFTKLVADQRDASPRELVRQVTRAVLSHRDAELRDDATLICLDWVGRGA
jgi:serine phosphatase RsbU (regulator of sigma subunit)